MVTRSPEDDSAAIEAIVRASPSGITAKEIAEALTREISRRTLQYRLRDLIDRGQIIREGTSRWAKYHSAQPSSSDEAISGIGDLPLSRVGIEVQAYVRQPIAKRRPVGYDRSFLESYRPNVTPYLSEKERGHLLKVGTAETVPQPAGTYARRILDRLLIDLSWNSSRLEGNTYSLLDTKRLIDLGEEAEGKGRRDAQMILNHKDAIEFLVSAAEEIRFNRYTILNLHAILANNLLADEAAAGRLRRIAVGIESSVFHPLEVPAVIDECFDEILATASAIRNPFEQAFFVMVQMPYLQPFDDVNKRVSRLAANIPLIKSNLCPLSFTDVPRSTYAEAMLGVYELRRIDLLRDVFIWAYERSAARYAAVKQSLGDPDPFRLRYRSELRDIVGEVVRDAMDQKAAAAHISSWVKQRIPPGDADRFREMAERELLSLHEGNFARYRIRPSEFAAWQRVWAASPKSQKPVRPTPRARGGPASR